MTATSSSWFDEAEDWVGWAWDEVSSCANAAFGAALGTATVALTVLLLIAIAPMLAHAALLLLLLALSAPLWFVVAVCFGS